MIVKVKSSNHYKSYDQCHIGISLGNANSQGTALTSIIKWINRQNFKHCFIDLSDTLHRHNYMFQFSLTEEYAFEKCREEGDIWLRNNLHTLENLNIKWDLYRWEHWLNNKTVLSYHELFKEKFIKDSYFRSLVFFDIKNFTSRHGASLSEDYLKYGSAYLLEELAVLSYYFENYPCAKLYPGREQVCFKQIRQGFIKNVPKGLTKTFYTQLWLHNEKGTGPIKRSKNYRLTKTAPVNVNDNASNNSSLTG